MKPILNKWQAFASHGQNYQTYDFAWRDVHLAVIKITSLPEEGARFTKKNYKGVWIIFSYWFPIRFR